MYNIFEYTSLAIYVRHLLWGKACWIIKSAAQELSDRVRIALRVKLYSIIEDISPIIDNMGFFRGTHLKLWRTLVWYQLQWRMCKCLRNEYLVSLNAVSSLVPEGWFHRLNVWEDYSFFVSVLVHKLIFALNQL